jgi:hypothetical protein
MNRTPDVELVLRDYFADDGLTAPDYVLDVVEERIGRQPRRHAWRLPWRLNTMNRTLKYVAAAAAVLVVAVLGYNLLPRSSSVGGAPATATPVPTASKSPSPTPATIVDPAAPGSDIPAAFLGTFTEGDWTALPTGADRFSWELLPAGDTTCAELVHVTTSCIVITRQPSDIEQYGPAAVVGNLLYYRMIIHNFQDDPCLNKISVWRLSVLADRLTTEQMDTGCRNSLDDAGFLLRAKP